MRRQVIAVLLLVAACGAAPFEEVEDEDASNVGAADGGGAIRVNEVLPKPLAADSNFVELANVSNAAVDLDGWYVSFGRRRVVLDAVDGHPSVVQPGGLALITDADASLDELPAWLPVLTPSKDLGELLTYSRKLIVRSPDKAVSDRADASTVSTDPGLALERRSDGKFAVSARGATPGERNSNADAGHIVTYFANPPADRTDPIAPQLAALIDSATTSLDAAFYQVNNPLLIDAFIRAKQRGLRVRMVTDTHYFTDPDYAPGYQRMIAAGIPIVDDKRTARMHDKFLVIDGAAVFTGSYNLIADTTRTFEHLDNAVLVRSPAFASIHTLEFEEMFGGKFGPNKTDNTPHEVFVDGTRVEVYFAPTDHCKDAILRALAEANDNIYFVVFSFYQSAVADSMIASYRAGVDLRGVTDDTGGGSDSQFPKLAGSGADVRRPTLDLWVHHKFIIVNYGSSDPIVITGSYNFSDKADKANDEAVYIIHDRAVAEAYYRIYRSIYDAASGPNTDTTNLATLAVTEVFPADATGASTTAPFVELQNFGTTSVDLTGLTITDRDGAPVALRPISDKGTLAAGARAVVRPSFLVESADPLVVYDARRRAVATFDAPRYPGRGKSLTRDDMAAPDPVATFTAGSPSPGR